MTQDQRLRRIFRVLAEVVEKDPILSQRIEEALDGSVGKSPSGQKRSRRKPALLDPFTEYSQGEESLSAKLRQLDIEALKDIVAQYGMDPSKLAMKWKSLDRIIDHIVTTVRVRAQRGDAFRR